MVKRIWQDMAENMINFMLKNSQKRQKNLPTRVNVLIRSVRSVRSTALLAPRALRWLHSLHVLRALHSLSSRKNFLAKMPP